MEGDGPEREDVHVRPGGDVRAHGLGGQIDLARLLDIALEMLGAGGARRGGAGGGLAGGGVPAHHLESGQRGIGVADQDGLGGECAVIEPAAVGVVEHLGELAEQRETQIHAEPIRPVTQEEVEPHGLGVVLEDQGGAELGLLEVVQPHDARMGDAFQDLKLAQRRPDEVAAVLLAAAAGERIDADAPLHAGAHMDPFEILPAIALGEQSPELVVAHPA